MEDIPYDHDFYYAGKEPLVSIILPAYIVTALLKIAAYLKHSHQ